MNLNKIFKQNNNNNGEIEFFEAKFFEKSFEHMS